MGTGQNCTSRDQISAGGETSNGANVQRKARIGRIVFFLEIWPFSPFIGKVMIVVCGLDVALVVYDICCQ